MELTYWSKYHPSLLEINKTKYLTTVVLSPRCFQHLGQRSAAAVRKTGDVPLPFGCSSMIPAKPVPCAKVGMQTFKDCPIQLLIYDNRVTGRAAFTPGADQLTVTVVAVWVVGFSTHTPQNHKNIFVSRFLTGGGRSSSCRHSVKKPTPTPERGRV